MEGNGEDCCSFRIDSPPAILDLIRLLLARDMLKVGNLPTRVLSDPKYNLGEVGLAVFIFSNSVLITFSGPHGGFDLIESVFREFFGKRSEGVNGIFEKV